MRAGVSSQPLKSFVDTTAVAFRDDSLGLFATGTDAYKCLSAERRGILGWVVQEITVFRRSAGYSVRMFGLTIEKLLLIGIIAVFLVGPEKLPHYAALLGRLVRQLRTLANGTADRLRSELGPELDEVDWKKYDPRQYDPRRIIRDALLDDGKLASSMAPPSAVAPPPFTDAENFSSESGTVGAVGRLRSPRSGAPGEVTPLEVPLTPTERLASPLRAQTSGSSAVMGVGDAVGGEVQHDHGDC